MKHFGQREFNSMFCEHIECFIVGPGGHFQTFFFVSHYDAEGEGG